MDFNFEIKNHNKDTSQILVMYSPVENGMEPKFKWVNISPEWSAEEIKAGIESQFPAYLWGNPINEHVSAMVDVQDVGTYTAPVIQEHVPTDEEVADQVRSRRRGLLLDSDWTQLLDCPLTAEQKTQWETYRQALRDVPSQAGFPYNVTWPTPPA